MYSFAFEDNLTADFHKFVETSLVKIPPVACKWITLYRALIVHSRKLYIVHSRIVQVEKLTHSPTVHVH